MKKPVFIFAFILINLMIYSCKGPEGPIGPVGPADPDGTNGKDGKDGQTDKQIRIELHGPMQTTNDQWGEGLILINFDIRNFVGVDSVILVGYISSNDTTNFCIVELCNHDDGSIIQNSTIQTNRVGYIMSGNMYQYLPAKEINIGLRIKSIIKGDYSTFWSGYLMLYRK